MKNRKTHRFLGTAEMIGAYLQLLELQAGKKPYKACSTIAKRYDVTDGTIRVLQKDVETVLAGGKVERKLNGREFVLACNTLSTMLERGKKQILQEQLPLETIKPTVEQIADVREQLDKAYGDLCVQVGKTISVMTVELIKENSDLRDRLEAITKAVNKVTNLQK